MALGVIVFLISRNMKTVVKYCIWQFALGIASIIVVNMIFPLLFSETIAISMLWNMPSGAGELALSGVEWSWKQVVELLLDWRSPFFVLTFVILISLFEGIYSFWKKKTFSRLAKIDYPMICTIWLFVPVFYLSESRGTTLTYYLQLLLPYMILSCCSHFRVDFDSDKRKWFYKYFGMICLLFVILYSRNWNFIHFELYSEEALSDWKKSYELLNEYDKVYTAPILSYFFVENNMSFCNYGQGFSSERYDDMNLSRYERLFFSDIQWLLSTFLSYEIIFVSIIVSYSNALYN